MDRLLISVEQSQLFSWETGDDVSLWEVKAPRNLVDAS